MTGASTPIVLLFLEKFLSLAIMILHEVLVLHHKSLLKGFYVVRCALCVTLSHPLPFQFFVLATMGVSSFYDSFSQW